MTMTMAKTMTMAMTMMMAMTMTVTKSGVDGWSRPRRGRRRGEPRCGGRGERHGPRWPEVTEGGVDGWSRPRRGRGRLVRLAVWRVVARVVARAGPCWPVVAREGPVVARVQWPLATRGGPWPTRGTPVSEERR
jgi:hypothetical protein